MIFEAAAEVSGVPRGAEGKIRPGRHSEGAAKTLGTPLAEFATQQDRSLYKFWYILVVYTI